MRKRVCLDKIRLASGETKCCFPLEVLGKFPLVMLQAVVLYKRVCDLKRNIRADGDV